MGCYFGVAAVYINDQSYEISANNMGICLSHKPIYVSKEGSKQGEGSSEWKIFLSSTAARKKFELDGSLPLATAISTSTSRTSRDREIRTPRDTDNRDRDKEVVALELKERDASYLELRAILDEPVAQVTHLPHFKYFNA